MTRSTRIGLIVNRSYGYYRDVLRGVGHFAESRPEWLFMSIVPERSLKAVPEPRPDGIIASLNTPALVRALARWRRPLINVSAVLPGLRVPRVGVDSAQVGQLAAAHLAERGLRHFGFVGPRDYLFSCERQRSYCQAVRDLGFSVDVYHTPRLAFDPQNRRWDLDRNVRSWLRKLPKPAGIFVPADEWGIQLAETCRWAGLHVPDEIAILGADDDDLECELTRPRLSSVIVPAERIGFTAADLLDRMLGGMAAPQEPILLPSPGVVTRKSTDTLALDDREVVAAVRFIRDHAHTSIQVSDVLRHVPLGRRSLERRCHQSLGHGLGTEIRRTRLERARRLLIRTDLPMPTIAEQAGFSSFRHMSVAFRRELNLTPTTYRRSATVKRLPKQNSP